MSESDRCLPPLTFPVASGRSAKASTVIIPGEGISRPLGTEQERATAWNKLGEILRSANPGGLLHEYAAAIATLAEESRSDASIESKKALRNAIASFQTFAERVR